KQIKRIISLCGSSMPGELLIMMDKYGDSPEDLRKAGIEYAIHQIQDLLDHDVLGIHLEPMNRPALAEEIIKGLDYKFI
ncbi:MAG: methylenetetrahydrofolate reductase [NAD(P)H], partial [Epulopiscium sp.]|nr:methylenetetrahydrofolate reductase [NAD(P)H] [Candidatus Epulonipiscium sp.]